MSEMDLDETGLSSSTPLVHAPESALPAPLDRHASDGGEAAREAGEREAALDECYSRLRPADVEEFYAGYQLWGLRQRAGILRKQIEILRDSLTENAERMEQLRPSAVALAVLARLQASGVNDIALLDQMLARGEVWLDQTMQRLDYCEQVEGFLNEDYTQWCCNALEGAYDWIDTARSASPEELPALASQETPEEIAAEEELLLQKFSLEDEAAMLEITLKRPAFPPPLPHAVTKPLPEIHGETLPSLPGVTPGIFSTPGAVPDETEIDTSSAETASAGLTDEAPRGEALAEPITLGAQAEDRRELAEVDTALELPAIPATPALTEVPVTEARDEESASELPLVESDAEDSAPFLPEIEADREVGEGEEAAAETVQEGGWEGDEDEDDSMGEARRVEELPTGKVPTPVSVEEMETATALEAVSMAADAPNVGERDAGEETTTRATEAPAAAAHEAPWRWEAFPPSTPLSELSPRTIAGGRPAKKRGFLARLLAALFGRRH